MVTDAASPSAAELSESLTQQGAKSAKRRDEELLALLAHPHIRDSEIYALRKEHCTKGNPTNERPWLDALKSPEGKATKEEDRQTNSVHFCSVDEISESPIQRGDKSAK